MIEVTEAIKQNISEQIEQGIEGQEILVNLVESEMIDSEYPQLYRPDGTFDEELDNKIQDAVILEIEEQLKK